MCESRRAAACAVALGAALACSRGDAGVRDALDSPAARQLAGAWTISFAVDTLITPLRLRAVQTSARGSLTLALTTHGPASMGGLGGITHVGVYDVDFTPLGFAPEGPGRVATAVARVVPARGADSAGVRRDSLYAVLSPDAERFAVRMGGVLAGDSASGTWSAVAFSAGGGSGHFVMHRRPGGAR